MTPPLSAGDTTLSAGDTGLSARGTGLSAGDTGLSARGTTPCQPRLSDQRKRGSYKVVQGSSRTVKVLERFSNALSASRPRWRATAPHALRTGAAPADDAAAGGRGSDAAGCRGGAGCPGGKRLHIAATGCGGQAMRAYGAQVVQLAPRSRPGRPGPHLGRHACGCGGCRWHCPLFATLAGFPPMPGVEGCLNRHKRNQGSLRARPSPMPANITTGGTCCTPTNSARAARDHDQQDWEP